MVTVQSTQAPYLKLYLVDYLGLHYWFYCCVPYIRQSELFILQLFLTGNFIYIYFAIINDIFGTRNFYFSQALGLFSLDVEFLLVLCN